MQNTWLPHLIELRKVLLKCLACLALSFVLCFYYADLLFKWLAAPLLHLLPGKLLAVQVASPLMVPIQLSLSVSFALTAPFLLYQLWRFVTPALYAKEKTLIPSLMLGSLMLFYGGMLFCFYVVFPLLFSFFYQAVPQFVEFSPDIGSYLSFTTGLMLSFGFCFQVPIVIIFLLKTKLLTLETLEKFRPYLIVSAFIIGMLLTPPDVFSQILLALPICLLFEAGLFIGKRFIAND